MKKIFVKTVAFTFLAAGMLVSCTSDTTTGVETENTETNMESDPNMGGKTGNSGMADTTATEEMDTTGTTTPVQ